MKIPYHMSLSTLVVLITLGCLMNQVSGSRVIVKSWEHCSDTKQDIIEMVDFSLTPETSLTGDVVLNAVLNITQSISAPIGIKVEMYTQIWILPIWKQLDCEILGLGEQCWYLDVCSKLPCPIAKGRFEFKNYHYTIHNEVPSRSYKIEFTTKARIDSPTPYMCIQVYFDVINAEGYLDSLDENSIIIVSSALLITVIAFLILIYIKIKSEDEIKYAILAFEQS